MPRKRKDSNRGLPQGLYIKKHTDPPTWRIRKRVDGRPISRHLGQMTREEATARYHKVMAEVFSGSPSDDPNSTTTNDGPPALLDFIEEYYLPLREKTVGHKTLEGDRRGAGWLTTFLGADRPLARITAGDIQQYVVWRKTHAGWRGKATRKQIKARTICIELQGLRRALQYAQDLEFIQEVPRFRMPSMRNEKPIHRWHTREQMEKVLDHAGRHQLMLATAYLTGMRMSELLTREWSDVDFERGEYGVIHVTHKPQIGFRVKLGKERVVPLCPRLRELLLEVPEENRLGYLFTHAGMRYQQMRSQLIRACNRAGVPVINPHATRKTFASLAAMDGVEIAALMEIGGWSTAQVLLEIYSHVDTNHARMVMASLSFGQVKEPTPEWGSYPAERPDSIPRLPSSPPFTCRSHGKPQDRTLH